QNGRVISTSCCGASLGSRSLTQGLTGCVSQKSISSFDDPIVNLPGGMSRNFMPMLLVNSTGTPRCLAQASWNSFAFAASNGATASGGAVGSCGDAWLSLSGEPGAKNSFTHPRHQTKATPRTAMNAPVAAHSSQRERCDLMRGMREKSLSLELALSW